MARSSQFGISGLRMRSQILLILMIVLAAVVIQTAVRIEVLNIQAGNYLPRKDRNPDGTFTDGKWRASLENTLKDQLRSFVQTWGLRQYLLAPLLLILSVLVSVTSRRLWPKVAGALSVLVAVIAISLLLYREYYQSLGW